MNERPGDSREEVQRLEKELARSRREMRQVLAVARASEEVALQSKRAMLQTTEQLERTVDQLRGTTESLQQATRVAQEASEAKSRFLAAMSHEIRTPMNGVIGSLELIRDLEVDPEVAKLVDLMDGSARALLHLLNDVLDFAKVEAGSLVLEEVPFSVRDCVEGVLAQEATLAARKRLRLAAEVEEDVPAVVAGDPFRLRQVVSNLVSNAVKFTAAGAVTVRVARSGEDESGGLRFQVTDTGIGIGPEALEHVFAPFVQADTSTTRLYGGTGLGLSISQGLVALMGGELSVESALGVGSTFAFTLPLRSLDADDARRAIPSDDRTKGVRTFGSRVLVVDDTPLNRTIATRMLERLGCVVESRENGLQGVEAARSGRFDLVLMDCSMPVMDGFAATAAIRALDEPVRHVPIVALTAHAMQGYREACLEAGMDDYLAKPVQLRHLEEVLARNLPGAGGAPA